MSEHVSIMPLLQLVMESKITEVSKDSSILSFHK